LKEVKPWSKAEAIGFELTLYFLLMIAWEIALRRYRHTVNGNSIFAKMPAQAIPLSELMRQRLEPHVNFFWRYTEMPKLNWTHAGVAIAISTVFSVWMETRVNPPTIAAIGLTVVSSWVFGGIGYLLMQIYLYSDNEE
jgi:hypothetical protein